MKLLDASALIEIDRGDMERARRLDDEGKHALSQVTVTEMFLGIEYKYESESDEYRSAREDLERLLSRFKIFQIDRAISIKAAKIIANLRKIGRPVDDLHEVYVAAIAVKNDLELLTANPKHFRDIEELKIQEWKEY
ncbi:MAG: type II toxin-antitoxin system VapC family toxin [Candidatus Thermoplasmatota archaeon]|nr:type II toxin-antitoxin system VapC family toxin [Candidatus Thermoplasmatota archaeon]